MKVKVYVATSNHAILEDVFYEDSGRLSYSLSLMVNCQLAVEITQTSISARYFHKNHPTEGFTQQQVSPS